MTEHGEKENPIKWRTEGLSLVGLASSCLPASGGSFVDCGSLGDKVFDKAHDKAHDKGAGAPLSRDALGPRVNLSQPITRDLLTQHVSHGVDGV